MQIYNNNGWLAACPRGITQSFRPWPFRDRTTRGRAGGSM
ncbi:hypothetical protein SXCC_02593 [Gluconacetobacter sp. SXCC-1]|nr:hypothetical protein SXCC_02593 [Gluconacetobacter sp. SXCC-1]